MGVMDFGDDVARVLADASPLVNWQASVSAAKKKAPSTMRRRLCTLRNLHQVMQLPDPTREGEVRQDCRRSGGVRLCELGRQKV